MQPIEAFTIKTSHYLIGAMALVAGLGWKDTMRDFINQNFPTPQENLRAKVFYSIVLTVIVILLIFILPDTKKELPRSTQEKIQELEEKRKIEQDIARLKLDLIALQIQNARLKNQVSG